MVNVTSGKPNPKGYTYRYPRPALMVDAVLFGLFHGVLFQTLLIHRKEKPFGWAIPGGHVEERETLRHAVERELFEETAVKTLNLEQFYIADDPKRDTRGGSRAISIVYYALVTPEDLKVKAGSDAEDAQWWNVNTLPKLCFDHAEIMGKAVERMRCDLWEKPILASILPKTFPFSQLRGAAEALLDHPLDPSNFRRDYLKKGFLEEVVSFGPSPSQMYRFKK